MEKYISNTEIVEMEQRKRASMINSLGGFKSVVLVGTQNKKNQQNLAIFNSLVHIGANPALVGFVIRPDSVERHTFENIMETGFYTINHITKEFYTNAHQTSARYPREVSEFEAANLTPEYKNNFFAPFVKESVVKFAVEFKEKHEFKINGTIFMIGQIKEIYLPEEVIETDGFINLEKAGTITCSGLDSYHVTQKLARLSYAKPDKLPTVL